MDQELQSFLVALHYHLNLEVLLNLAHRVCHCYHHYQEDPYLQEDL